MIHIHLQSLLPESLVKYQHVYYLYDQTLHFKRGSKEDLRVYDNVCMPGVKH